MLKGAFKATQSAGLLPAFGWTLLIVAVLATVAGFWVGKRWEQGAHAIEQRATDRKTIEDLAATARRLQEHAVDGVLAYDQAMQRMDAIATTLESNLETNRRFLVRQQTELEALHARRPDLGAYELGPDVLQHWNRSNQGAAASPAATGPAGQPAHAVPGPAAGQQQQTDRADRQPRRSGRAVPRLPRSQPLAGAGGGRMAGHRLAVVLQRGGGKRRRWVGVPGA